MKHSRDVYLLFSELFHGNKNPNDTVSFDINSQTRLGQQFYSQLKAYFNLTVGATRFNLSLTQALDLEKLYREWVSNLSLSLSLSLSLLAVTTICTIEILREYVCLFVCWCLTTHQPLCVISVRRY